MPAARDYDWSHVHVLGDKGVAAQYLSFARKLLGFVKQDAGFNNLGVRKEVRRFEDGTIVTAEIHGTIPRITIQVAPKEPAEQVPVEGIVVVPRNGHSATPIDATQPEELVQTHKHSYRTLFYTEVSQTYKDFVGPHGLYKRIFKDGVPYAGNIDWTDGKGLRINWYGPTRRYWYDFCVLPQAQYGGFVFSDGYIVLDVSNVPGHTADLVVGASLVKGVLRVMLASMPNPIEGGVSRDYPNQSTTALTLYDFATTKVNGKIVVSYKPEDRTQRWAHSAIGLVNPWMVSPDGVTWITMSFDPQAEHDFATSSYYMPSTWHEVHVPAAGTALLSVKECTPEESATSNEVSLLLAVDFKPSGQRCEVRAGFTYTTTPTILGSTYFDVDQGTDDGFMSVLQAKYEEAKASMAGKYVGVLQRSACYLQVGSMRHPTETFQEYAYGIGEAHANAVYPTPRLGYASYGYIKTTLPMFGERVRILAVDARNDALAAIGVTSSALSFGAGGAREGPDFGYTYYYGQTDVVYTDTSSGSFVVRAFVRVGDKQYAVPLASSGDGYTPYLQNNDGHLIPEGFMYVAGLLVQDFDPSAAGTQRWYDPASTYWYSVEDRRKKIAAPPDFFNPIFSVSASYSAKTNGYSRINAAASYAFNVVDSDIPSDKSARFCSVYMAFDDNKNFVFTATAPTPIYRQYSAGSFYRQIRRPKIFISNLGNMLRVTGVGASTPTFDAWCSKAWAISKRDTNTTTTAP